MTPHRTQALEDIGRHVAPRLVKFNHGTISVKSEDTLGTKLPDPYLLYYRRAAHEVSSDLQDEYICDGFHLPL